MFRLMLMLLGVLASTLLRPDDDPPPDPGGDPPPQPDPEPDPDTVARYTQNDLKKIGAQEKRDGRTSKEREILDRAKQYGVESLDDVFSRLEEHQTLRQQNETDAERLEREKKAAEAERDQYKSEAEKASQLADQRLIEAELKGSLISAGVDAKRVRKILADPDLEKPTLDDKGEVQDVDKYIEKAQQEWPELFGQSRDDHIPPSPPVGGTRQSDPVEQYMSSAYGDRKQS